MTQQFYSYVYPRELKTKLIHTVFIVAKLTYKNVYTLFIAALLIIATKWK